jgi:flavodoxin
MARKRVLVVYYSRTGMTRTVAGELASALGADVEELVDTKARSGPLGLLRSIKDGILKRPARLKPPQNDPGAYDLVVIGTPVWANTMSSPVRVYLTEQAGSLPDVAFFLTTVRSGAQQTFRDMQSLSGKAPVATLPLFAKEVKAGGHEDKVQALAVELRSSPDEEGT